MVRGCLQNNLANLLGAVRSNFWNSIFNYDVHAVYEKFQTRTGWNLYDWVTRSVTAPLSVLKVRWPASGHTIGSFVEQFLSKDMECKKRGKVSDFEDMVDVFYKTREQREKKGNKGVWLG